MVCKVEIMTKEIKNNCHKVNHLKMYWLMFSSCSYPGPPGPGPGSHMECVVNEMMVENSNDDDDVENQNIHRYNFFHRHERERQLKCHISSKNTNKRRNLLDSNLLWIFLGFIWLSNPTIVGCRDNEPLENGQEQPRVLVSNCDFNRLERSDESNFLDDERRRPITTTNNLNLNNNNNCTYIKFNYYNYIKNNNTNSASTSESPFINNKSKKQSLIDSLRIENIKFQILSKLGLKTKPNVTNTLSRQVIMDTLQRADETFFHNDNYHRSTHPYDYYYVSADNSVPYGGAENGRFNNNNNPQDNNNAYYDPQGGPQLMPYNNMYQQQNPHQYRHQSQFEYQPPYSSQNFFHQEEDDDFIGKTREIISFAGKGECIFLNHSTISFFL